MKRLEKVILMKAKTLKVLDLFVISKNKQLNFRIY
jgi:hypothetical protein